MTQQLFLKDVEEEELGALLKAKQERKVLEESHSLAVLTLWKEANQQDVIDALISFVPVVVPLEWVEIVNY